MDDIEFYPSAVKQHPEFAASIAHVLACGGFIDCTLASILTLLLHAEPRAGTAMYIALTSAEARRQALLAAAEAVLSPENFTTFKECIATTKAARERRNAFAHHLWGHSEQLPDALLLIPPEAFAARDVLLAEVNREITATGKAIAPKLTLNPSEIQVYRKPDFDESERLLEKAVLTLDLLRINTATAVGYHEDALVEVSRTRPGQLEEILGVGGFQEWTPEPNRLRPQSPLSKSPPEKPEESPRKE